MSRKSRNSGRLRYLVQWQRATTSPVDGSCGQDVGGVTVLGTFWAELIPIDGEETFNADQLKATRPFKITTRNLGKTIVAGDQLVFQGRTLTITSVYRDLERPFWLEIKAIEQAQGVTGGP